MTDPHHLPVNDEIVRAAISNPCVTCDDIEALIASIGNCEAMGGVASPWIQTLLELEGRMVLAGVE